MRNAFAAELTELGLADPAILLLSGDIGNKLFDKFKEKCPGRFLNCGIAEANMMGMAAGLALNGLRPIAYTIAPFVTTRCLEQIRVDVCYHEAPVVIAGVGAGLSYASLGATHHSCEDVAFLRALPGMTVLCPGDAVELRHALRQAVKLPGPSYIRMGKKGEPVVHGELKDFRIGKAITLQAGSRVCLISTGTLLPMAVEAARALETRGISTSLVSMHTVKPLDTELLEDAFARFEVVTTIEEHSIIGGLGSAVAEWMAEAGPQKARLARIATPDKFWHTAGEQEYAREMLGLSVENITHQTLKRLPGGHA